MPTLVTSPSRLLTSWHRASRRPATRWAPLAALALGLVALVAPREAAACEPSPSSSNTNMQALGVSQDGSSGWYRFWHRDEEGDESAFFLLDAAGHEMARLEWTADTDQEGGGTWDSKGSIDWKDLAHEGRRPSSIDSISAEIQRRYGLTALRASSSPVQVTKRGEGCGRGEVATPDGPVTLVEIGGPDSPEACPDPSLALFEHPSSGFFFLHVSYLSTRPTYDIRFNGFELIPRTRLAGGRAAARGRKAQLRGDLGKALALYDEALRLAPEYVAPRIWAAEAAVAARWSPASGLAFLEMPFPDNQPCLGDGSRIGEWVESNIPISWLNLRGLSGPTPWDTCEGRPSKLHSSWTPAERPLAEEPSTLPKLNDLDESRPPAPVPAPAPVAQDATVAPAAPGMVSILDALKISVVTSFLTAFALGYLDQRRSRSAKGRDKLVKNR